MRLAPISPTARALSVSLSASMCVTFVSTGHTLANIKTVKTSSLDFGMGYKVFFLPPKSRSKSQSAIFSITPFDGKCQNLQMSPTHFCASSYIFRDIIF